MPKNDKDKNTRPASPPEVPMDPDVEARRSGPPPGTHNDANDLPAQPAHPVSAAEGDRNAEINRMIEEMLKDPTFDPSGVYRERLAKYSMSLPGRQYPATTDVDVHGDPVGDVPHR